MTPTPKRFLDERSDADDFERAILRSELDASPPAGAEGDVLNRVMAVVGPLPGGPGPSDGSAGPTTGGAAGAGALAKSVVTLGGLGKGFALGIVVSVAVASGTHFVQKSASSRNGAAASATLQAPAPPVVVPAPVQHVEPPSAAPETADRRAAPSPPSEALPPRPGATAAPLPEPIAAPGERTQGTPGASSVASFPSDGAALAASRLREEAALLRRARAELRAGALAAAFATLEASRQTFSAPELVQEREALAIELLYRSGERAAAALRAREFLARYPESPHAAAVRAFGDDSRR